MRPDPRQRTLRTWRARRALRGLEAAETPPEGWRPRVRQRHRAPTPRLALPRRMPASLGPWPRAGLTLCAAAALVATAAWHAPALHVRHAAVQGNQRLTAEDVVTASGVAGRHMLAVDWQEAERRVAAVGGVRWARVRPDWPAGVSIVVGETEPVLLWASDGVLVALDETGTPLPVAPVEASLPRVTSSVGLPLGPDGTMGRDLVAAATTYCGRFQDVAYDRDFGFVGRTADGWQVRLGADPALATRQLAALQALASQLGADARPGVVIDLRFPQRPYYRLQGSAP
jgi:cell division septal protein FtsQ